MAEVNIGSVAKVADVDKDIVSAFGGGVGEASTIEIAEEEVTAAAVGGGEVMIVVIGHIEGGHGGDLEGMSGTDGEEIMYFTGLGDDMGGGDDVAKTPAGDGVGFGEGATGDGTFEHAG